MDFATDIEIGSRVAQLREEAGETQANLASLLDLGQPAVSRIERGERSVSGRELAILAQHFGVPNSALVAREDSLVLLRGAMAEPERVRDAVSMFREYVDFHFGVEALAG
jgi:transcriptional regulator with XRE-family HTH domain